MGSSKASPQNRFMRIITIPIRALGKARDMYVRSMTNYADKVNYTPTTKKRAAGSGLPKSFGSNSGGSSSYESEDFRELVRAASARRLDLDLYMQSKQLQMIKSGREGTRRSSSVVMSRIEEDRPFGEDGSVHIYGAEFKKESNFPRSKNHTVTSTTRRTF